MADIIFAPYNEAYTHVWTSESIEREVSDEFSFIAPGSEYMQKFRKSRWDGRIKMFSRTTKLIPTGLLSRLTTWAEKAGYTVENRLPDGRSRWSGLDTASLIAAHPLPFEIRDYQQDAVTYALHQQRGVLVSPTASGKSLILYLIIKARMSYGPLLLIVPTISLVAQMFTDFESYGWTHAEDSIHCITGGVVKDTHKPVVVSTWQSIFKQPKEWFDRYTTVLGDECVSPDTKISMSDGSVKPIKEICVGDLVLTVNEQTGKIESKPVLLVHKNISRRERKYQVTLSDGQNIIITGNHKIMLSSGEWKRADSMELGDMINTL